MFVCTGGLVWFSSANPLRSDPCSWLFDWLIQDVSLPNLGDPSFTLNNSHLAIFLLYEIWFSHNQKIFRKIEIHPSSTILQVILTSILLSHKYWRTCFNLLLLSPWKKNLQSMKERRRRKRGYLGVKYAMCLCVKYADNELWRRASWMRV